MATVPGVTCSVVQLAQHPPPMHMPLDKVALPTPIPSHHVSRRPPRESHGGFRWHRPAFQPFQLKPWARDPDLEMEMRDSLAVLGPNNKVDMPRLHQRSLTAPPITVSSLDVHREKKPNSTAKSPQSSPSVRELLTPVTKRSVATFPARPPLSKGKQVPGRFFPKPTLTEEQKVQLETFRRMRPRKAFSLHSASPSHTADVNSRVNVFDSSASVSRMDRQHSPSFNQRIARTRQQLQKERSELRSEVFAICFKQDLDNKTYDPHSELHSDYYSIKRLKMPMARLGRPGKSDNDSFAVVLRGHRKHLHKKMLLTAESTESLVESLVQPARSAYSVTRRSLHDDRDSPRRVIDIETPKADRESEDQESEASGAEPEERDNTLAPLNSPTDHKEAAFPTLV